MQAHSNHGLAGKARRVRDVSRSHRLHSLQLIEEYLDWESPQEPPERYIPIRGCSEFMPSAELAPPSGPDDSGAGQFEFRLASSESIIEAEVATEPIALLRTPEVSDAPSSQPVEEPLVVGRGTLGVIRPPRTGRQWALQPVPRTTVNARGFLYGCALGGAAAAVLLLIVRILLS